MSNSKDIRDYNDYIVMVQPGVSFNPGDNINTSQVVNYNGISDRTEIDYILVTDEDDNTKIVSRWYVVDRRRNLSGQWEMQLHRDLVADYLDVLLKQKLYIYRAMLGRTSKYIFNSEGLAFNQIKKDEVLLKDETGCGWLVGYVAKNWNKDLDITVAVGGDSYPTPPISYEDIASYNKHAYTFLDYRARVIANISGSTGSNYVSYIEFKDNAVITAQNVSRSPNYVDFNSRVLQYGPPGTIGTTITTQEAATKYSQAAAQEVNSFRESIYTAVEAKMGSGRLDNSEFSQLLNMQGIWYQDGATIFRLTNVRTDNNNYSSGYQAAGIFASTLDRYVRENSIGELRTANTAGYEAIANATSVYFDVEVNRAGTAEGKISSSARILIDAPYRMFAIPVGESARAYYSGQVITPRPEISKALASFIATELGGESGFLYDLQYLPYCPKRSDISDDYPISIHGNENEDFNIIRDSGGTPLTYILWCSESNFSLNILHKIEVPDDPIKFKVEHETTFYRLCSPNYNGAFEFKPTSNYGVEGFEINCTYRPFQPYIHVNPMFTREGLYGGDYNDQRGLVCSGSFSIPVVTDHWINYEISNASYANAFQRQIENMETTFGLGYNQQLASGVIGAVGAGISGAASGAMLGAKVGGPAGTLAGLIGGGH